MSHYSVIKCIRNVHSRNLSGFDAAIYKMFNHEVDLVLRKSLFFLLLVLVLLILLLLETKEYGQE